MVDVGDWSAVGDVNSAGTGIHDNCIARREMWWNGWEVGGAAAVKGV